jgi:hypothetical protein
MSIFICRRASEGTCVTCLRSRIPLHASCTQGALLKHGKKMAVPLQPTGGRPAAATDRPALSMPKVRKSEIVHLKQAMKAYNGSSSSSVRAAPAKPALPSHRVHAPDLASSMKKRTDESINDLDCVLFLDVDGVLHSPNPKHTRLQFQKPCMEFLREICNETGCKIVLSTTWRLHQEARDHLAKKLAEHGCPLFVSRTPSIAQFQRVQLARPAR